MPPTNGALTAREFDALLGIAEGETVQDLANRTGLTFSTAQSYRKRAVSKLGGRNAAHAVQLAYHHGLLHAPVGGSR